MHDTTFKRKLLALALASYSTWLEHPDASLHDILDEAFADLRGYLTEA